MMAAASGHVSGSDGSSSEIEFPSTPTPGEDAKAAELKARIAGLRERVTMAPGAETNVLVLMCTKIEGWVRGIIDTVKRIWNRLFGKVEKVDGSEDEDIEAPRPFVPGPIPQRIFALYREQVRAPRVDRERVGEVRTHLMHMMGRGEMTRLQTEIDNLFALGLTDTQVAETVLDVRRTMADADRGPIKQALDVALNKSRWLHLLRWVHTSEKQPAWSVRIENVPSDGACMLTAAVKGLPGLVQEREEIPSALELRQTMFRRVFDGLMRASTWEGREFRRAWLASLLAQEPIMGEEPLNRENLPRDGWESELIIRFGLNILTDEGYRTRSIDSYIEFVAPGTEIPRRELQPYLLKLNRLVEQYKALQLDPRRPNGETELLLLAATLGRAVCIFTPNPAWSVDQIQALNSGPQTLVLRGSNPVKLRPVDIYGAELLPPFEGMFGAGGAELRAPLPLLQQGIHYSGVSYRAPRA